jgi:hypothetical protein
LSHFRPICGSSERLNKGQIRVKIFVTINLGCTSHNYLLDS